jgi:hypothetical protein
MEEAPENSKELSHSVYMPMEQNTIEHDSAPKDAIYRLILNMLNETVQKM